MAMGFDLAQGWAAYLKREVEGWGGVFETRDPNWSTEAGAQAITEVISSDPQAERAGRAFARPQLLLQAAEEGAGDGIYVILIDNPMNFPADAFIGSDWDRLGQLEAEAAVKGCGRPFVEEDRPGAGRCRQRVQHLPVQRHHEGAEEESRLQGGGEAVLQLGPDHLAHRHRDHAAAEPGHLRHHRLLGWRRDRRGGGDPRRQADRTRCSWSPPAAARCSTATTSTTALSARS